LQTRVASSPSIAATKKELVIAASDDDDGEADDSSDGGFMDLMSTFDPKKPGTKNASHSFTETPRAKRTMSVSHSSPLTTSLEADEYPELHFAQCKDGQARPFRDQATFFFRCKNVNLHHFLPHSAFGSATGQGSSSWGWTSDDGREFAIIAQADGAAFAEVIRGGKLRYIGRLPQTAGAAAAIWREIRVFKHYIVVGSESFNHHIQIFDLKKLLDLDYKNPKVFDPTTDVTGFYGNLPDGRAHNVLTNDESGFAYVVGARPRTSECRSGLIFLDLSDPSNPTSPGCASADGYVHDAQCLIYRGPHTKYLGREICYGYNEDSLTIYDVTDKKYPELVSVTGYEGATYTHQGWVLDTQNQEFLILDDEYDEHDGRGPGANGHATTFIWDIRDLEHPKQTGYYQAPRKTIDHNQYVFGNYSYQSNYGAGLSILDISSIPQKPNGSGVHEVGWFDVYRDDDQLENGNGGILEFVGSWSSYAGFKSGYILINTIEQGAFLVKVQDPQKGGDWTAEE
jgi:choice-of-anchor B domain-containing protein